MRLPRLPRRLQTLLALLPPARSVADVGAGHGALALHLAARYVARVIATEAALGPYQELRRNLDAWGATEMVETRLGNGLAPLERGEVEGVVAAGMGARSLLEICAQAADRDVAWVALQCVQDPELIEPWRKRHGWQTLASCLVHERGHQYSVWLFKVAR